MNAPEVRVVATRDEAGERIAARIVAVVEERERDGDRAVLGLATGRSPLAVYRELAALSPDLSRTITFNLDELWPLRRTDPRSYHRAMQENLVDRTNLRRRNVHVPPGDVDERAIAAACGKYEVAIRQAGGIDLQLLGVGRNGHIAFNEPGSARKSRTRRVELAPGTREDNGLTGPGDPRHALTMGVATILEALEIHLVAFGESKAEVVARALQGPIGPAVPASFLRGHPRVVAWLDAAAAAHLDRGVARDR